MRRSLFGSSFGGTVYPGSEVRGNMRHLPVHIELLSGNRQIYDGAQFSSLFIFLFLQLITQAHGLVPSTFTVNASQLKLTENTIPDTNICESFSM